MLCSALGVIEDVALWQECLLLRIDEFTGHVRRKGVVDGSARSVHAMHESTVIGLKSVGVGFSAFGRCTLHVEVMAVRDRFWSGVLKNGRGTVPSLSLLGIVSW